MSANSICLLSTLKILIKPYLFRNLNPELLVFGSWPGCFLFHFLYSIYFLSISIVVVVVVFYITWWWTSHHIICLSVCLLTVFPSFFLDLYILAPFFIGVSSPLPFCQIDWSIFMYLNFLLIRMKRIWMWMRRKKPKKVRTAQTYPKCNWIKKRNQMDIT